MVEAWVPSSPAEMLQRIYQNEIMKKAGFSERLMHSIMVDEMPDYSVVRRLIQKYGADEARRRLEKRLHDNQS